MYLINGFLEGLEMSNFFGVLSAYPELYVFVGLIALFLAYTGSFFVFWSLLLFFCFVGAGASSIASLVFGCVLLVFNIPLLRGYLLSLPIMSLMTALKFLPKISETERTAIEAGNVWMDAELFSGKPNYKRLMAQSYPELSDEERSFLEGPVEKLCSLTNDWEVYQKRDFSDDIWNMLKKEKFFGMIIPKEYGGLGFSPSANSAVVEKLSSRSTPLGITVMVPNSLGPSELLLHYGTQRQKDYYLPRLAVGQEVPCFALTESFAASDAGAMASYGVVFEKDGEIMIRLNWKKRYITLAAISTVIGLAFKLYDPDSLLGDKKNLGITCALIPATTPGVSLGQRHDPMGVPFYNCPLEGVNVEIPISAVIGEKDGAGKGWKMLMECLSVGRGISLPANASGGTKLVARVAGAYGLIRKQFGLNIGKFEGIEDPLARIGGAAYMLEAARKYTCGGLDNGEKPSVVSAIVKYNFTEKFRSVINDGMDILAGAGISNGPRNLFAHPYKAAPIGVTVEGANILTRTLIVFGQGAIRCHPYVLQEIKALETGDVKQFDYALWKHVKHVLRNGARSLVLFMTRGWLSLPFSFDSTFRYYQKLSWVSAAFAFHSDVALGTLGGDLKRKERLTGRFADILSMMYMIISVLKRYQAEGKKKEDLMYVHWCCQYGFASIQTSFEGIYSNMGKWYFIQYFLTRINPFGKMPSDNLGSLVAQSLQRPGEQRDRLTKGMYTSSDPEDALGRFDTAFTAIFDSLGISKRLNKAISKGDIVKATPEVMIAEAVAKGLLTQQEADQLLRAEVLRKDAVQVDDFSQEEYLRRS